MSIYITGDTHGERERFLHIEKDTGIKEGDFLIICGDFGYVFNNDESERLFLDSMQKRCKYTVLFIDGNHENHRALAEYPVENWNGGKIHKIRNNIYHLMRGQVYKIDGKTFFTMGGAYSIDRYMRQKNVSYWDEEIPCDAEYKEAVKNLNEHSNKVDYMLTHTAPQRMIMRMGKGCDPHDCELTGFLDYLLDIVQFRHWFAGHWHTDKQLRDDFTMLWFNNVKLP